MGNTIILEIMQLLLNFKVEHSAHLKNQSRSAKLFLELLFFLEFLPKHKTLLILCSKLGSIMLCA